MRPTLELKISLFLWVTSLLISKAVYDSEGRGRGQNKWCNLIQTEIIHAGAQ